MNRTTAIALALALLGTATLFGVNFFLTQEAGPEALLPGDLSLSAGIEHIVEVPITRTYTGGVHTFTGSIDLPTACHTLSIEGVRSGRSDEVGIIFMIIPPEPDVVCAQVITPQPFVISFAAPASVEVIATLNSAPIIFVER